MMFPPRAVRDINVRFTRPSCTGGTASVTVDVEPLPDGARGFVFVDAVDWSSAADEVIDDVELRACADAVGLGVLLTLLGGPESEMSTSTPDTLRGRPFRFPADIPGAPGTFAHALGQGVPLRGAIGGPPIAARVVLRAARHHIVDSHTAVFRKAGRAVALEAMDRLGMGVPGRRADGVGAAPGRRV